jgi:hypothetical protein
MRMPRTAECGSGKDIFRVDWNVAVVLVHLGDRDIGNDAADVGGHPRGFQRKRLGSWVRAFDEEVGRANLVVDGFALWSRQRRRGEKQKSQSQYRSHRFAPFWPALRALDPQYGGYVKRLRRLDAKFVNNADYWIGAVEAAKIQLRVLSFPMLLNRKR